MGWNLAALVLATVLMMAAEAAEPALSVDFYANTCPQVEKIVLEAIARKQRRNSATAAGTLRLFFHDCFVEGCDASVLVRGNATHPTERDAEINHSLPGDALEGVNEVKAAVEEQCPGVVSCADVLAMSSRDLLRMLGGPWFPVLKGRRDGLISQASRVDGNLPLPKMSVDELTALFLRKGFTMAEMVVLSGGHSVGFAHCKEFMDRLYSNPPDRTMNPSYVAGLQKVCPQGQGFDPDFAAFNDVMTPFHFDNVYYQNLQRGLGLMRSDQILFTDPRTRPLVQHYAANQSAFFRDFAAVMVKLSGTQVKTGYLQGEIRRRCDAFN